MTVPIGRRGDAIEKEAMRVRDKFDRDLLMDALSGVLECWDGPGCRQTPYCKGGCKSIADADTILRELRVTAPAMGDEHG